LYFGRALKSYGQGRAVEHRFPASAKPFTLGGMQFKLAVGQNTKCTFITDSRMENLDWLILRSGSIRAYRKKEYLELDISWFVDRGFSVIRFDCSKWTSKAMMHEDLATELNFPDYYGKNLDALTDCLVELEINDPGLVLVFSRFDTLGEETRDTLTDIFDHASRAQLSLGKKMIGLLQVDDPKTTFSPIQYSIIWNSKEWLDSNRLKK